MGPVISRVGSCLLTAQSANVALPSSDAHMRHNSVSIVMGNVRVLGRNGAEQHGPKGFPGGYRDFFFSSRDAVNGRP